MIEVLLDPEVIGNAVLVAALLTSMFVVQKWVDKHHPHH